jgi:SAM-dependent methyltransferase
VGRLTQSVAVIGEHWRDSRYYQEAESWTYIFWMAGSPFRNLFDRLDLTDVLDLACGHGRHAEKIAGKAGRLSVMDLHAKNIEICRRRIGHYPNVSFFANNGYDFQPIPDNSLSAIFCYDSMVHFSPDIVASYLNDAGRVLKPGGRALFHHSNYDAPDRRRPNGSNPGARTHMTERLIRKYARKAGLQVEESLPVNWGEIDALDRLTLFRKPDGWLERLLR